MAFGRKRAPASAVKIDQTNVAQLALEALRSKRATNVRLAVRLRFNSPIMMHCWSQKAVIMMLGNMTGDKQARPPKDLTEEFQASIYRNVRDEIVIPTRVIKACIVNGAGGTEGMVSKAQLKRELRVMGHATPVRGSDGKLVETGNADMDVRIASNNGTPDIRSRALFPEGCYVDIVLQFPVTLTPTQVMAAIESAGQTIGVCDMRPEKGHEFGTFEIETENVASDEKTINRILRECSAEEKRYQIPESMRRAFSNVAADGLTDGQRKVKALVDHVNGQNGTEAPAPRKRGRKSAADKAAAEANGVST